VTDTAELTKADCLRLLGTQTVGRVVFTSAAMPAAEPVSYILHGNEIIFRVPADGPLATGTRNAVIGFQADDIDPTTRLGWSVLGIGHTHEITDLARRTAVATDTPSWGPDTTSRTIALPLQHLSGHPIQLRLNRTCWSG
jgi:nitroimidazol reductase NimA-like FMN-containing flavoprotein (pyridoxamine 5'-phosphate oxidase superfamily)